MQPLVPDKAPLAPLEAFAATGVPPAAALARELSAIVPTMLALASPAARDGGMLDRLQAGAERLVRIRPIKETPGDDRSAGGARSEVKAARGGVEGARAEVPKLPASVRTPAG